MKRIISITLILALTFLLCSCDLSKIGTQVDGDMPDLVLKATSKTEITLSSRDQKFSFSVEVDPDTLVGDELKYQWFVYMKDGDAWADVAFFRGKEEGDYGNDRPVFDETVPCGWNANFEPAEPLSLCDIAEAGYKYKITCIAVNPFPGSDGSERKSYASVDFYINVDSSIGPLNF